LLGWVWLQRRTLTPTREDHQFLPNFLYNWYGGFGSFLQCHKKMNEELRRTSLKKFPIRLTVGSLRKVSK
jgi:hypothetical protein